MASEIDHFGLVSDGLGRAEIGVSPPLNTTTAIRPDVEAKPIRKPSIRHSIGAAFPAILAHPQHGLREINRVIKEKKGHDVHGDTNESYVPVLAPDPPAGAGDERMEHPLEEEKKFPSVKEFVRQPISALKTIAADQGGNEFAENIAKSEVSHAADVRLLKQDHATTDAPEGQQEAERTTFIQQKHARQDAFVRWSIDRHVKRVAILPEAAQPGQRPSFRSSWKTWTDYGSQVRHSTFRSLD